MSVFIGGVSVAKLVRTINDFRQISLPNFEINPFHYHNGKDFYIDGSGQNAFVIGGQPTVVDGVRGKALKMNGGHLYWSQGGLPASDKYMISLWVKPDASDVSTSNSWRILATSRKTGLPDVGLHLAIYNSYGSGRPTGLINWRMYGTVGNLNYYTHENAIGNTLFNLEADKWYHIVLIYNKNDDYKARLYVNGKLIAYNSTDVNPTNGWSNPFTVGDMLSASNGTVYPFQGVIDEVIYAYGDNVWTPSQVQEYYDLVTNGQFLDYEEDGTLRLGKKVDGTYTTTPISWESGVIDLGEKGFVDYGLLQAIGTKPSGTNLIVYTRTSGDGNNWTSWTQVPPNGLIQSPNMRYIQVRVVLQSVDGSNTPIVDAIQLLQEEKPTLPNTLVKADDPLYLYRDLETGLKSLGVVKNAYDITIEEEVKGEDTLSFKLPVKDAKRQEIGDEAVEMLAVIGERYYIVKEVIDKRDNDGKLYSEFICEARWTELREWYAKDIDVSNATAKTAIETIFANIFREAGDAEFDWKIGIVEVTKRRTLQSEWNDVLSLLREVEETWGGELLFDTKNKVVHLLGKIGKESGVRFYYNKNLKNIERRIDTYDLVTRIYPEGKGGLDIKTVNNGVPYLENTTWVDRLKLRKRIIPYRWKDERYTIPENLKEDAQAMLDEMSKPRISYTTTIHDLSTLTGHEHESFQLGDTVTIIDEDLFNEIIVNRVVRRKQDVRKPENTTVELSQPLKTLADVRSRAIDEQIQNLVESDPLSTTDVQQMTVFNHLLNSRADDGFSSWEHDYSGTKFELANAGFSGSWSFKVTPEFGKYATLTQTVEGVSHRSTYTISASVATEGKIVRGSSNDAFVGIKILVYYEGEDEPEVHYLAIPDITSEGEESEYLDFEK